MSEFRWYRKKAGLLRPYVPGEPMDRISVGPVDREKGSPKIGDWIARNPHNPDDQWLVAAEYFAENFEPIPSDHP